MYLVILGVILIFWFMIMLNVFKGWLFINFIGWKKIYIVNLVEILKENKDG